MNEQQIEQFVYFINFQDQFFQKNEIIHIFRKSII